MSTVSDGKVVIFHYTLTNQATGETLDTSRERGEPMPYLHGAQNIVPGLEEQMVGKAIGDSFIAVVPPEKAYGIDHGVEPEAVPRTEFPADAPLQPGMPLRAQTPDGQVVQLWIANLDDENVYVSQMHPLAGVTLSFDVEIVNIRDANDNEKTHGHPHGIDGTSGHGH